MGNEKTIADVPSKATYSFICVLTTTCYRRKIKVNIQHGITL